MGMDRMVTICVSGGVKMSYENNLQSLESQLRHSLESDTPIRLAMDRVFAGSYVDQERPTSGIRKIINLIKYEPGEPTEVPVVDGTPYLGLGMHVSPDFTSEDFENMIEILWEDARGYSTRELFGRIRSEYGDVQNLKDAADLLVVTAGAVFYKAFQRLALSKLKRTYRVNGLELFFFENKNRNYIYINATDIDDYKTTLWGAEKVASYLDLQ